jgi:hypothetical protein
MIREEFKKILDKHGKLTAEIVVEEARAKDSPLHEYFDWNNKEAGEKWRLHQARLLIVNVKIEKSETHNGAGRYFIHNGDKEEPSWRGIEVVVSDTELMINVMDRFKREAMAYIARIRNLGEYKNLSPESIKQINKIEKALDKMISAYIEIEEAA